MSKVSCKNVDAYVVYAGWAHSVSKVSCKNDNDVMIFLEQPLAFLICMAYVIVQRFNPNHTQLLPACY